VKDLFFLNPRSDTYPQGIVPLEHADGAIARRANLTTSVTEDATLVLVQPKGRSFGKGHCFQVCDISEIIFGTDLGWFTNQ
jgi:hypothetical protein